MSYNFHASTDRVVVIDNGGGFAKFGFAGAETPSCVLQNCTFKQKGERGVLYSDQLDETRDILGLNIRRPIDRGYVVNWDLQKEIWNRAFQSSLRVQPRDCALLMTEPLFNLKSIQDTTAQVVFEEYGFKAFHACPAPLLAFQDHSRRQLSTQLPTSAQSLAAAAGCGLVVDAGFSFTHVVPIFDGRVVERGVRRINIGGKAMTNHLKQLISYRSVNVMDETYLVDIIKEALCFVSQNLKDDMKLAAKGKHSVLRREYVLPDGVHNLRGYVRDPRQPSQPPPAAVGAGANFDVPPDQILNVNNERMIVPEIVFNPLDVGLDQAGVAECAAQSVAACHVAMRGLLTANTLLCGGVVDCPGFQKRFEQDFRPLIKDTYDVVVHSAVDPAIAAWRGGSAIAASAGFRQLVTTKAQYDEWGRARLRYEQNSD